MNTNELIRKVLTDDQAFSKDHLDGDLRAIESAGDQAVPIIQDAVVSCASGGFAGSHWWQNAPLLCKVLRSVGTPRACEALLAIVNTDSRIGEYDGVRGAAAKQLGGFRTFATQLIPWLEAASNQPHAPKLAIHNAIEELGGTPKLSPSVIIEQGRNKDPVEAIEYFASYQQQAQSWDKDRKRYFFHSFALKVEAAFRNSKDEQDRKNATAAALPYMAAAHLAAPSTESYHEYWGGVTWTPENTRKLSEKHPLPSRAPRLGEPLSDSEDTTPDAQKRQWWQFWKG